MKKKNVILADNHQNMLEGIRGLLETMFESVVMVADETSLIRSIDRLDPDLVVVDLSLPVSSEANIAKRLIKHNPELKILIMSIHDDSTVVERILDIGISGFVLKRTAANDLIPAIKSIREGKIYVSPSLNYTENSAEN